MEVKNRLLNYDDMIIYQNTDWFNFSLDSVLLANFVNIKLTDKKIIDFATGNAPVPMLLTYKTKNKIYGIDIQKEVLELGKKSVIENNLEEQIELINEDIKNIYSVFRREYFDIITCNPPYFECNLNSNLNENDIKTNARHETLIKLEEIIKIGSDMLKNRGSFNLVHRTNRLLEVIELLKKNRLEPKRLQLIYPKNGSDSNIFLIEARKNANKGVKVLAPLIIHDEDGNYRQEIKRMFGD